MWPCQANVRSCAPEHNRHLCLIEEFTVLPYTPYCLELEVLPLEAEDAPFMNFIKSTLQPYYLKYKLYLKSASLYLFASLFAAGLKILTNPVMAKNLSHDDYAIIGYFNSFGLLFLPMLNLMIVAYYQANYYLMPEEKRERAANTIILSLVGIGTVSSFLVLTGLFAYFKFTNVNFPFWPFAIFSIYQIVFSNFLTFLQVKCRLKREAEKYAKITVVNSLIWVVLAILLVVVFKFGAKGSMGANLLVAIVLGGYSIKATLTKFEFDYTVFKDAVKFSWPVAISALLWYFFSGVDGAMLERLNDTKTFALYNIGVALSSFLAMFHVALGQTFEPDIYKAIAEQKLRRLTKIIAIIVLLNAIPVLLFVVFARPLTDLLTAGRYTDAASFARIISLANITMSFYYSVIAVIFGFGFTKSEMCLRAIGAGICIFMFSILIKYFGFYGAAWGQVISFFLMFIIGLCFILYKLKTNTLYANRK